MNTFIAAIPLFSSDMSVLAYRLCYRIGKQLFGSFQDHNSIGDAMMSPGLDLVETLGVEPFTGGRPLFVEINEFQLLVGAPTDLNIPPDKLICLLTGVVYSDENILSRCKRLKELGYGIAIEWSPGIMTSPFFEQADYVVVNTEEFRINELIGLLRSMTEKKRVLAANVPDMETFGIINNFSGALYSGYFYNRPVTNEKAELSPVKINAMTLMQQINEEDFDLSVVASAIGQDLSLSVSLLQFINNSITGLSRKIDSIKNAVAILGQKEVKKWATAVLSTRLAEDRPSEYTRISLIRARFAENLAPVFGMGIFASSLFMVGLFSLLDAILQKPMSEAVSEVALDDWVSSALVEKDGDLYEVLDLIYAYEHANWDSVAVKMVRYNIKLEEITNAFIDSLIWYKHLLDSINAEEALEREI